MSEEEVRVLNVANKGIVLPEREPDHFPISEIIDKFGAEATTLTPGNTYVFDLKNDPRFSEAKLLTVEVNPKGTDATLRRVCLIPVNEPLYSEGNEPLGSDNNRLGMVTMNLSEGRPVYTLGEGRRVETIFFLAHPTT